MSIETRRVSAEHKKEQGAQVARWRAEIIDSVLTHGILPESVLLQQGGKSFRSADENLNDAVWGRALRPLSSYTRFWGDMQSRVSDDEQRLRNDLEHILYNTINSILPVMMEREKPIWKQPPNPGRGMSYRTKALMGKMLASCFMVVTENHDGGVESISSDAIRPESFYSLIFPVNIWTEFQKNGIKEKIHVPTKIVNSTIIRDIGIVYRSMTLPDFETPLLEIVHDDKMQKTDGVWVHGVRLPIIEDLPNRG